jgi:hypothetical protein
MLASSMQPSDVAFSLHRNRNQRRNSPWHGQISFAKKLTKAAFSSNIKPSLPLPRIRGMTRALLPGNVLYLAPKRSLNSSFMLVSSCV